MVIENPVIPFFTWLNSALPHFLIALSIIALGGILFGFLVAAVRRGPTEAFYVVAQNLVSGVTDFLQISPRRIWAVMRLVMKESVRTYLMVACGLFLLMLLFGGWFLDPDADHPARLYLGVILPWSNMLAIILAVFVSTFSLPNDIKNKTIYTITTKPVVAWELILGRIFGFCAIGSLLVGLMCISGYVFIVRGLSHTHQIDAKDMIAVENVEGNQPLQIVEGPTSRNAHHRHVATIYATTQENGSGESITGTGKTDIIKDHYHKIVRTEVDGKTVYHLGPAEGMLQARVPIYGTLRFLDKWGRESERGRHGLSIWAYRSLVEGGTGQSAIWRFSGVDEQVFPNGELPLEMSLRVVRLSKKRDLTRATQGTIVLRNPATGLQTTPRTFDVIEFAPNPVSIPRKLQVLNSDGTFRDVDLFEDLVEDGDIEIIVRCAEARQFLSMAQHDLYLRAADGSFAFNFARGYVSIWFQMVLVTCFGVFFSTILSGPVAMLSTVASLVLGFFASFISDVANGTIQGGGPLESACRLVTQQSVMTPLAPGYTTSFIKGVDYGITQVVQSVASMIPNYSDFDTSAYIADGFQVPGSLLPEHFLIVLAYFLVLSTAGYFLLKTREIAA